MTYEEFVGNVQHHARLGSEGDTMRAIEATLATLAERIPGDQADHLAAQLPAALGAYVKANRGADRTSESFDLGEFYERVARREGVDLPDAVHHAKVVMNVVREAITPGEMDHLWSALPDEYNEIFDTEAMAEAPEQRPKPQQSQQQRSGMGSGSLQ